MPYRTDEAIAEANRSILVVALGGEVLGIDSATGDLLWRNRLPGGGDEEVFVASRYGVLVVSSDSSALYRLDYATGATMWQVHTSASGRATIVIEPELIVVAKGGEVDAFDHDGGRRWSNKLAGMGYGRIALAFPG